MCFDVSIPIRLICSTDGLLCLRSATTSVWHARCRRGPSTPTTEPAQADGRDRYHADATGVLGRRRFRPGWAALHCPGLYRTRLVYPRSVALGYYLHLS